MTRTFSLVLLAAMLAACKPAAKPADTAAAPAESVAAAPANAAAAASAAEAAPAGAPLEPGVPKAETANPLQGQVDALNKAKGVEGNLQSQADERQKAIDAAAR